MKLIIGTVIAGLLLYMISLLHNVLLPFFMACLIAYLINPLVTLNHKWIRTKGRTLPVIVTLLEVVAVIGGICYAFVPSTVSQIDKLGVIISKYANSTQQLPYLPEEARVFLHDYFNINNMADFMKYLKLPTLVEKGTSMVSALVGFLTHTLEWLLMFIYIIFILIDYRQIGRGFRLIFPPKHRDLGIELINDMKYSMNHYFRGQGFVALCAMVLYCIGFSIVGIPLAFVLGVAVGVLYMIPYFQYITLIPVALVCFINSLDGGPNFWLTLGECCAVYVVSQCICDYIITPKVMGKELDLNPAIILLSLSIWGSLLGIIGMIIALPVTSLILSYYQRYISGIPTAPKPAP